MSLNYDTLAEQVIPFKLSVRIFDVFGETLDMGYTRNLFAVPESELDHQLCATDVKLGRYGLSR